MVIKIKFRQVEVDSEVYEEYTSLATFLWREFNLKGERVDYECDWGTLEDIVIKTNRLQAIEVSSIYSRHLALYYVDKEGQDQEEWIYFDIIDGIEIIND